MQKLIDTFVILREYQKNTGIGVIPATSVVSPLFPGQFNYCLEERHLYKKYGDFVSITNDETFQKVQPAIRLGDYNHFFTSNRLSPQHLAQFHIATINGGTILRKEGNDTKVRIHALLDFITKNLGLDKRRLFVNYFGADTPAREIEASYKTGESEKRVLADYIVKEDIESKQALLDYGLREDQLMPNTTRDCFLTTNWDVTTAPWGYRNEFYYKMDDGSLLDIATVERLELKPIIEVQDGKKYVVDIEPMERSFFIDGGGLERMTLAMRGSGTIFDVLNFEKIEKEIGLSKTQIESIRMLHRIFTDSDWQGLGSWQRKQKAKYIMRTVLDVPEVNIRKVLHWNTENYKGIFDDLANSHDRVIAEIDGYRKRLVSV